MENELQDYHKVTNELIKELKSTLYELKNEDYRLCLHLCNLETDVTKLRNFMNFYYLSSEKADKNI